MALLGASFIVLDLAATSGYLPNELALGAKALAALLAILAAWFATENIVQSVLQRAPFLAPRPSLSTGPWNIRISFDDNDGRGMKEREGQIEVRRSLLGVRVIGGELRNPKTDEITMNQWFAIDADLINYDKHDIIYYLYKIPMVRDRGVVDAERYEKIGYVFARRNNGELVFTGEFFDIQIGATSETRQRRGSVKLWQTKYA